MKAQTQYKLEQAIGLLSEIMNETPELDAGKKNRLEQSCGQIASVFADGSSSSGFYAWLEHQKNRPDSVGELARLAAKDKKWPRNGRGTLVACAERLEMVNLTQGGPALKGRYGSELVETFLYPAWEEYVQAECNGRKRASGA